MKEYYHNLYRFQDVILGLIDQLNLGFYLGGGTALSRFYLAHRYSDDLDFFFNHNPLYVQHVQRISEHLMRNGFKVETFGISQDFARFHIMDTQGHQGITLKADFINEKSIPHFGEFKSTELFSKIDNPRNILSNKLTFVYKKSPKDFSDIWLICKYLSFGWEDIIREAGQKRAIEPLFIVKMLKQFSGGELKQVHWIKPIDINEFEKEKQIMIQNIITKDENKLFSPT